jgi:hypothetical protein
MLAAAAGNPLAIRTRLDGAKLTVLFEGTDAISSPPHVYIFDYVELSALSVPGL